MVRRGFHPSFAARPSARQTSRVAAVPLEDTERARYAEIEEDLYKARHRLIKHYGVPAEPIGEFLKAVSLLAEDHTLDGGGGLAGAVRQALAGALVDDHDHDVGQRSFVFVTQRGFGKRSQQY